MKKKMNSRSSQNTLAVAVQKKISQKLLLSVHHKQEHQLKQPVPPLSYQTQKSDSTESADKKILRAPFSISSTSEKYNALEKGLVMMT